MATKTEPTTVRERVYLTFPEKLINEPVLSLLAKRFDVIFNIRGSTVTSEMALVSLKFEGAPKEVAKAIAWLKRKGVSVEATDKRR
ncbi:MAG: FeS-binding protein [Deltaproteobacteria bacterium]|nr:FeS-binding protein [Deltaproteobacteria bacterium]